MEKSANSSHRQRLGKPDGLPPLAALLLYCEQRDVRHRAVPLAPCFGLPAPKISNRQIPELESPVSYRKQSTGPISNRHNFAFCNFPIFRPPAAPPSPGQGLNLLDFLLSCRKLSTSQFLIDNFGARISRRPLQQLAAEADPISSLDSRESSTSNRPAPRLEILLSHRKQRTDSFLIVPNPANLKPVSAFFDRLGVNRNAGDLRELLLDAVLERRRHIVNLRDGQAAVHRAVAGNENPVLHAAHIGLVAIHQLVEFRRQAVDEIPHAAGELVQLFAARDPRAQRLNVDIYVCVSARFAQQIVLKLRSEPPLIAQARMFVHFQMELDEELALHLMRRKFVDRKPAALRRGADGFKEIVAGAGARLHVDDDVGGNNFFDAPLDAVA